MGYYSLLSEAKDIKYYKAQLKSNIDVYKENARVIDEFSVTFLKHPVFKKVKSDALDGVIIEKFSKALGLVDWVAGKMFMSSTPGSEAVFLLKKYLASPKSGGIGVMLAIEQLHAMLSRNPSAALERAKKKVLNFVMPDEETVEKYAEAPPKGILGRVAFAEKRQDAPPFLEPDTKEEKRLYSALVKHVDGNVMLSKEDTDMIKQIMKKGHYESIFKQPQVGELYRGMQVSAGWLKKALGITGKLPRNGGQDAKFTFTPRRGDASSWTTNLSTAKGFTQGDKEYSVVLYAAIEDNPQVFIDMQGGLYNLHVIRDYSKERECIAMGKVRVHKITWVEK